MPASAAAMEVVAAKDAGPATDRSIRMPPRLRTEPRTAEASSARRLGPGRSNNWAQQSGAQAQRTCAGSVRPSKQRSRAKRLGRQLVVTRSVAGRVRVRLRPFKLERSPPLTQKRRADDGPGFGRIPGPLRRERRCGEARGSGGARRPTPTQPTGAGPRTG